MEYEPRAFGGNVEAGKLYKVGELNEPELFRQSGPGGQNELYMIPAKDGTVSPVRGAAAAARRTQHQGSASTTTPASTCRPDNVPTVRSMS